MKTYNVTMTATYTTAFDAESEEAARQEAQEWLINDPEAFTEAATIINIEEVIPCMGCDTLVPAPTEQVLNSGVCDSCTSKAFAEAG